MDEQLDKIRQIVDNAQGLPDSIAVSILRNTKTCPDQKEKKGDPENKFCIKCWKSFISSGVFTSCRRDENV